MPMILRSSQNDQRSMYSMSYSMRFSREVLPRSPWTCAQPVTPDLTLCRNRYPGTVCRNRSTNTGRSGRGPTTLISPRRTLTNCGSSSRLKRRRNEPMGVRRSSPAAAHTGPVSRSASIRMVRSFITRKRWPSSASRRPLVLAHQAENLDPGIRPGAHALDDAGRQLAPAHDEGIAQVVAPSTRDAEGLPEDVAREGHRRDREDPEIDDDHARVVVLAEEKGHHADEDEGAHW